jgi:hypothetical protein
MELQEFAGKVTIFVNVASKCGYTDANYKGEQAALITLCDRPAAAARWLLHLQHVSTVWRVVVTRLVLQMLAAAVNLGRHVSSCICMLAQPAPPPLAFTHTLLLLAAANLP